MTVILNIPSEIDDFVAEVIQAASHHAPHVSNIVASIAQAIRARQDFKDVEVYTRNGNRGRTCWVVLSGKRYAFSYRYNTRKIEIRNRTVQGSALFTYDGTELHAAIQRDINSL